ncbi:MAG: glycosyltransferase family 2 protein [Hydrogenophilus sp.]|nr:glycosyltransferase family 2 protein [Hydrogenophilus sp.]
MQQQAGEGEVAAVVVEFDSGGLLVEAVRSLAGEVAGCVVVDNGSQRPAAERLAASGAMEGWGERLQVIRNASNRGFAAACNQGLVATSSPFVFFLNPDAVVMPGGVARLRTLLERQPRAGMVGPLLVGMEGNTQWGGCRELPGWRAVIRRGWAVVGLGGRSTVQEERGEAPEEARPVGGISGAAMLVRRAAVAEVGVWDEGFFLHGEDLDWCARFWAAGWEVWVEPGAVVRHVKGGCSRRNAARVAWHKAMGVGRFLVKHRVPARWRWGVAPWVYAAAAAGGAILMVRALWENRGVERLESER